MQSSQFGNSKPNSTSKEDPEKNKPAVSAKSSWLAHKLNCLGEDEIVLARDANIRREEDWYDINDPRNPLNIRRRNEST